MSVNSGILGNGSGNSKEENFFEVVSYISENYTQLQKELSEISRILSITETLARAYANVGVSFIKLHNREYKNPLKLNVLAEMLEKLESIKNGSKEEFVQGVEFVNIIQEIINREKQGNVVVFAWEAQKVLKYIIYELERINNNENPEKKVAILKGMMAYY